MPTMQENPYLTYYVKMLPDDLTRENFPLDSAGVERSVDRLTVTCFGASYASGWHTDLRTGELIERNAGEMMMLMVSEIAEAMEGHRKGLMDDKLPHRLMVEVELADALIRIFDFAGRHGLDLGGAVAEKIAYNLQREDHKPENRLKPGGKAY